MYSYSKLKGLSLETRFTKKYKDVTDFNFLQTLTQMRQIEAGRKY